MVCVCSVHAIKVLVFIERRNKRVYDMIGVDLKKQGKHFLEGCVWEKNWGPKQKQGIVIEWFGLIDKGVVGAASVERNVFSEREHFTSRLNPSSLISK